MKRYLLPDRVNAYKANLHIHSNISDGEMSPEEIKRAYLERGYSVVAFTDHEVMVPHPELTDSGFLALTATEISINQRYDCDFNFTKTYHLNIYSPQENKSSFNTFDRSKIWLDRSLQFITAEQEEQGLYRVYTVDCVNEVIDKANREGCLVSYNHPVWSLQDYSDYIDLKGLWGVEVYNNVCAKAGFSDSATPMDDLLRKGQDVFPLATDDAHRIGDCFGGFVMIMAEKLSYDKIFSALKNGDFYASAGPEIYEISIEDGVVRIASSPVSFISVSTDCRCMYSKASEDGELTDASIDINDYLDRVKNGMDDSRYIRVTLTDKFGRSAFSRAYFINEIKR